ncbi:hypothetical protein [Endozoicomonas sp. 4G]|uniref:hypothetical protein n=1 Tax=Endozoicomonas sp. 4G TaxID=2872754 RepID=UPI0020788BB1|nr:hypothetical protein [Endozoicomonas sp. 4G]
MSDVCADDVLEKLLDEYSVNIAVEDPDLDRNTTATIFALLYIADKLDSIDTRLLKLVTQQKQQPKIKTANAGDHDLVCASEFPSDEPLEPLPEPTYTDAEKQGALNKVIDVTKNLLDEVRAEENQDE